jgi:cytochrome c oxidase cbb3-type subunit 2
MRFVEKPDRFGRTLVLGIALWTGVALVVFVVLKLAFPNHPPVVVSGAPPAAPACKSTVSTKAYDPTVESDPARPVLLASSPCSSTTPGKDTDQLLHAWLDGAELDGSPKQPAPTTVDAAMRARGAKLYLQHCATCHGASGDGEGQDKCAVDPPPAVHKSGVFELRTTEHEALPTDEDLFRTISRGIHGTAMPPWIALPESDRWALVAHVKSLSKAFTEDTAPPSIDFGKAPDATPERIAAGQKLYATGGCASCHGDSGHGNGPAATALKVPPRDFTTGHFHRGSSVADIHATLVTGLDGTPMGSFAKVLPADDMWNLALYVHSLAPVLVERNGLMCPAASRPLHPQELFGIRNLMHLMHEGT